MKSNEFWMNVHRCRPQVPYTHSLTNTSNMSLLLSSVVAFSLLTVTDKKDIKAARRKVAQVIYKCVSCNMSTIRQATRYSAFTMLQVCTLPSFRNSQRPTVYDIYICVYECVCVCLCALDFSWLGCCCTLIISTQDSLFLMILHTLFAMNARILTRQPTPALKNPFFRRPTHNASTHRESKQKTKNATKCSTYRIATHAAHPLECVVLHCTSRVVLQQPCCKVCCQLLLLLLFRSQNFPEFIEKLL